MTIDERKVQLGVEVDATGARRGFEEVKSAAVDMAKNIAASGRQAGEALDQSLTVSSEKATSGMVASVKRATAAVQREIAAGMGGKGSADYFDAYGAIRGADPARLQPVVAQLRDYQSVLSVTAAKERELAEAQAFSQQREANLANFKRLQYERDLIALLDQQAAKERELAAQNGFIAGLQSQAAAIGKTRAELLELKAAELGVSAQAAPFIAQLKAAEGSLHGTNVAAKQAAWALRLVPAQMTDIVTSLQMGQHPMTVLIQQGGQLKDMFGGVGPAVRAMSGYLVGLATPINLAVTAAAGLSAAFYLGRKEAEELGKAIILSGNATGASVSQLNGMAAQVAAATNATKGLAVETLAQLATTGQVGAANMALVAQAAINMERYAGKAIGDTVKDFAELGKSPVEALYKLNQQYRFLTPEIYAQVKALEEQGRMAEAAAKAQEAYAGAANTMTGKLKENLGVLERMWRQLKDDASGAWDAMLDIGREDVLDEKVRKLRALLADRDKSGDAGSRLRGLTSDMRAQLAELDRQAQAKRDQDAKANAEAEKQRIARQAGIDWSKEGDRFRSERQKLEIEAERIRTVGEQAGADPAEIAARIAKMRESYDQGIASAAAEGETALAKRYAQQWGEHYSNELEHFRLSTEDFANKMAALERYALETEHGAVASQRPSDAGKIKQAIRLKELAIELDQVDVKRQARIEDGASKFEKQLVGMEVAAAKAISPMEAAVVEFRDKYSETMQRAAAEGGEAYERAVAAAAAAWQRVEASVDFNNAGKEFDTFVSQMETRLNNLKLNEAMGSISGVDAMVGESAIRKEVVSDLDRIIAQLRAIAATINNPETAAKLANFEKKLSGARFDAIANDPTDAYAGMQRAVNAYGKDAANVAKSTEQAFTRGFAAMEDAMVQFTMTGKMSFTGMANSIVSDLIRMQYRAMLAGQAGPLGGLFNGISDFFSGNNRSIVGNATAIPVTDTMPGVTQVPLPSAHGNAFSGVPALSAYSGSIVDRPTLFPFARGAGLMGEAGPEAILPLTRGKGGYLGVRAESSAPVFNLNIKNEGAADGYRATGGMSRNNSGGFDVDVIVRKVLMADQSRNGPITQGYAAKWGLRNAV